MMERVRVQAALLSFSLLLLTGCGRTAATAVPRAESPKAEAAAPPPPVRARILAVGDLLMHTPLVTTSALPDGGWDFKPLFAPVRPWLEGADFAIANLETTLTGPAYPWAGYPVFNTPPEFARDVKAVGFDALTHANNHSLDYGEYGLKQTSEALERYGVPHTGTSRTPAERESILVVNVAPNIKMAVLAYAYGTNGIPLPQPWSVNMLDPERIAADVKRARALPDVDLVAVALHMGEEYARRPNEQQESYVNLCLQAGADIILGDHPHVIQRAEMRRQVDAAGGERRQAVIYSLGNFISNQVGLERLAGLMLLIDVKKEQGLTTVEQVSVVPTYVHTYWTNSTKRYRVVAVEKAMRDYEIKADPLLTADDYAQLKAVWADTTVQAVGEGVTVWSVDKPVGVAR